MPTGKCHGVNCIQVAGHFSGSFWRNGAYGPIDKGTIEMVSKGLVLVVAGQKTTVAAENSRISDRFINADRHRRLPLYALH